MLCVAKCNVVICLLSYNYHKREMHWKSAPPVWPFWSIQQRRRFWKRSAPSMTWPRPRLYGALLGNISTSMALLNNKPGCLLSKKARSLVRINKLFGEYLIDASISLQQVGNPHLQNKDWMRKRFNLTQRALVQDSSCREQKGRDATTISAFDVAKGHG